jgi:hypothetical protein
MVYVGVDPGRGGGLALLAGRHGVETAKMPATERDVIDLLKYWKTFTAPAPACKIFAVIEHVWSIPGQGGAFAFGVNVGTLRTALTAAEIPFDQVLPRKWQSALGVVYRKGATDTAKKNITKRRAQQLFPSIDVTHAIADALLLAEYCRRYNLGLLSKVGKRRSK